MIPVIMFLMTLTNERQEDDPLTRIHDDVDEKDGDRLGTRVAAVLEMMIIRNMRMTFRSIKSNHL